MGKRECPFLFSSSLYIFIPSFLRCIFLCLPANVIVIFPAKPSTHRQVHSLEGQPPLSEKTLNTCDSLLSDQQQRGYQGRGGRRDSGAENRNNEEEKEETTSSCFVPTAVNNMGNPIRQTETKKGGRRQEDKNI